MTDAFVDGNNGGNAVGKDDGGTAGLSEGLLDGWC